MPSLSQFPLDTTKATGRSGQDLKEFLRWSEWGKRENRVWSECCRHYAERRGFYTVNQTIFPFSLYVNPVLLGGYISENIPQTVAIAHARMCSKQYMPEARVASPLASRDDLFAENASNQFIHDHWYRNRSRNRRDLIAQNLIIEGDDFLGLRYDPDQIGSVKMTESQIYAYEKMSGRQPLEVKQIGSNFQGEREFRCEIHTGGTVEYRVPRSMVFVEDGPTEWEEVTRFAVVSYPSVHAARLAWAGSPGADKIRPVSIVDLKGAGTSYLWGFQDYMRYDTQTDPISASPIRDRTCIAEFWVKEGPYWHRNVRTGAGFADELDDESGIIINPFVHYRYTRTGDFWSQGLVQGMLIPAHSLNVRLTQLSGYISRCAKTTWMAPKGSNIQLINNDYNTLVWYDGMGQPPVMKTADTTILSIFQALIELDLSFLSIGGQIGEAGMGDVPARTSAQVLRSTQQAVYGALDLAARHMQEADCECAKKILLINQKLSDWPRMAKLFGDEGAVIARSFQGSDISSGTMIRTVITDAGPESRADRQELAVQLLPFMIPGTNPVEFVDNFVDGTSMKDILPIKVRYSENEANEEYQLMMSGRVAFMPTTIAFGMDNGRVVEAGLQPNSLAYWDEQTGQPRPLLQQDQMDEVHVDQHEKQLLDPNTPHPIRDLLTWHVNMEHRVRMEQQRQRQEAQALDLEAKKSIAIERGNLVNIVTQSEMQKEVAETAAKAKAGADKGGEGSQPSIKASSSPSAGGKKSGLARSK